MTVKDMTLSDCKTLLENAEAISESGLIQHNSGKNYGQGNRISK
jgi:hypothetical protein